jgi:cytochrome c553
MRIVLTGAAVALALAASPATAAGDVARGRQVAVQCAMCHGIDGLATRADAPNLAGESPFYLETQLEAFRSGRRQHETMTIIAAGLSEQDIADVAAWYAAIRVSVELPR